MSLSYALPTKRDSGLPFSVDLPKKAAEFKWVYYKEIFQQVSPSKQPRLSAHISGIKFLGNKGLGEGSHLAVILLLVTLVGCIICLLSKNAMALK